ncbi:hypothetical protein [Tritonibacter mobilis]|uniref:hypothetical protein n=1 Tax=Tritonibacter mobilis TaxID=379347 RepID=UPI000806D069|nr:hypothetical protein [Tritonibacter mobilis]
MAGIQGRVNAGSITKLYFVTTKMETKDQATVAAAAIEANEVIDLRGELSLGASTNIIELDIFGEAFAPKMVGAGSFDDVEMTCVFNSENAIHEAIRSDKGRVEHTFIYYLDDEVGQTYYVFDGYIGSRSIQMPYDGAMDLSFTVVRSGPEVKIDVA